MSVGLRARVASVGGVCASLRAGRVSGSPCAGCVPVYLRFGDAAVSPLAGRAPAGWVSVGGVCVSLRVGDMSVGEVLLLSLLVSVPNHKRTALRQAKGEREQSAHDFSFHAS